MGWRLGIARRDEKGFTIVELLIIIVVIAILASLSIVIYGGIQDKAQKSLVAGDSHSVARRIEAFKVEMGDYPQSISDCPTPTPVNLCLGLSDGVLLRYDSRLDTYAGNHLGPGYNLGIMAQKQFLYVGEGEREGTNEFLQYANLAPYIDRYGLRKYRLSFDIKSTDASRGSQTTVYLQNGSGSKYHLIGGEANPKVSVSEEYAHKVLEVTPKLQDATETNAFLAFYGAYGTGNRPVVKNVRFELAD